MTTSDGPPTGGRTNFTARWRAAVAAMVAVAAGGVALLVAAAGDAEARTCHQAGTVEVCLVGDGPNYEIEGTGFRPGSDVTVADVTVTGNGQQPMVVRAGDTGELPDAGVLGILEGDEPQRFALDGTASDGAPASVELAVPARKG